MVIRDLGNGRMEVTGNGHGVSFLSDENALELGSGDGCIVLTIY